MALYLEQCIFSALEEGLKYNDNDKYTNKDRKNDKIRQLMFSPPQYSAHCIPQCFCCEFFACDCRMQVNV